MLTAMRNNRSLTFYQQIKECRNEISPTFLGGILSAPIANTCAITAAASTGFNTQLCNSLRMLNTERYRAAQKVSQMLSIDLDYKGGRNDGVGLAWKYEKADVEMGGKGSAKWNNSHRLEIKEAGKVRGAEGHHQQNVGDHPEQQANPDNIKIYKCKKEHLNNGHGGNWKNETNGQMMDKNKMLKRTNAKRVFKNELCGLGVATAIGAGVGFTMGFVVTLAQTGVNLESLKIALAEGKKSGLEAGIMASVSYFFGRTVGVTVELEITGLVKNIGVTITENIARMVNMGTVGTLTIVIFSVYQFVRLKRSGVANRNALILIGKQMLFSLSLLVVSIVVQGVYGGCAGTIVGVSIGVVMAFGTVADSMHQRSLAEKVRIYTIDQCYPNFE